MFSFTSNYRLFDHNGFILFSILTLFSFSAAILFYLFPSFAFSLCSLHPIEMTASCSTCPSDAYKKKNKHNNNEKKKVNRIKHHEFEWKTYATFCIQAGLSVCVVVRHNIRFMFEFVCLNAQRMAIIITIIHIVVVVFFNYNATFVVTYVCHVVYSSFFFGWCSKFIGWKTLERARETVNAYQKHQVFRNGAIFPRFRIISTNIL